MQPFRDARRPTRPLGAASSMPSGPHAHVCRSRQSGTSSANRDRSSRPLLRVEPQPQPVAAVARVPARPSSSANSTSDSVGAECKWTTSVIWLRRASVRSIDITGVMPEPPVRNSTDARRGIGHHEVALRRGQPHDRAGRHPADQVRRQETLGHRLDGDRDGARRCGTGLEVSEYDRHRQRPSISSTDPDVLAGLVVEGEAPAGLDDQRRGVDGLPAHLQYAAPQFARRPQRVGQLQVVVGKQRRGDAPRDGAQRVPARVLGAATGRTVSATLAETFIGVLGHEATVP